MKNFDSDFAKIINVDGADLLITKKYDDEEEKYLLGHEARTDGVIVELNIGFNTEASRDKAFDGFHEGSARTILTAIKDNLLDEE